MLDHLWLNHAHHLAFEDDRHRHNQGKLLGSAFVIVHHGEDRFVLVMHYHHLGGGVVEAGVCAGHIEAAEGHRLLPQQRHEQYGGSEFF